MSVENLSTSSIGNVEDDLDFYLIIHMKSLVLLLQQLSCSECNSFWDGSVSVKERNGLYMQLEFICYNCGSLTRLCSSPQML
jgi:hypothetical protein